MVGLLAVGWAGRTERCSKTFGSAQQKVGAVHVCECIVEAAVSFFFLLCRSSCCPPVLHVAPSIISVALSGELLESSQKKKPNCVWLHWRRRTQEESCRYARRDPAGAAVPRSGTTYHHHHHSHHQHRRLQTQLVIESSHRCRTDLHPVRTIKTKLCVSYSFQSHWKIFTFFLSGSQNLIILMQTLIH